VLNYTARFGVDAFSSMHLEKGKATRIIFAYTFLAKVYDSLRPAWAKLVMGRAESYLENTILPRILTSKTRILDLGSGTGVNLDRLRRLGLPFASYTGLDLTPAMLLQAQGKRDVQKRSAYSRGDMRYLPFANQSFDLVLSTWALSHISPAQQVLSEADRVLKKDGVLVFLFWSLPPRPMSLVASVLEPLLLLRFVNLADLQAGIGKRALIRRFAGGWGASVVIPPV